MGAAFSGPSGYLLKSEYMPNVSVCVPFTKYKPFPVDYRKGPGELISSFRALPSVKQNIENAYWWVHCQFVPNDDSTLMVTSSAFHLRPGMCSLPVKNVPAGRICKFSMNSPKLKCEMVGRMAGKSCPKVQVHPDSSYIFYYCYNELKIFHITDNTGIHTKAIENHFRQYQSFALSPDGKRTCILARDGRTDFDLIIFGVNVYSYSESTIHLSKINKDFCGTAHRTEIVDCKWSPDSSCVAVSISTGYLMLIDFKSKDIVCNVFPDVLDDPVSSSTSAFDFDPRSCQEIMAIGSSDRCLYIINTSKGDVWYKSEPCKDRIDAVQYSQEGTVIGVALHSFNIHLYNSNTCDLVFTLNMAESCPELDSLTSVGIYPYITKIEFTRSGEQLVTCCSDGFVRIWQLHVTPSLQDICKLKLLSLVTQEDIKCLPLPARLKNYLLPLPIAP